MKTNKSFTKRIKVTRRGKLLSRRPGQNHFNAKESRSGRMNRRRSQTIGADIMTPKVMQRYIGNPKK